MSFYSWQQRRYTEGPGPGRYRMPNLAHSPRSSVKEGPLHEPRGPSPSTENEFNFRTHWFEDSIPFAFGPLRVNWTVPPE